MQARDLQTPRKGNYLGPYTEGLGFRVSSLELFKGLGLRNIQEFILLETKMETQRGPTSGACVGVHV